MTIPGSWKRKEHFFIVEQKEFIQKRYSVDLPRPVLLTFVRGGTSFDLIPLVSRDNSLRLKGFCFYHFACVVKGDFPH